MNRRRFVQGGIAGIVILGTGGLLWPDSDKADAPLTIDASLRRLDDLMEKNIITLGDWNLAQILVHCAQSVEFSMTGFPEQKSALFKRTLGSAALAVFTARGAMAHSLNEPIPGAPLIAADEDIDYAYNRFQASMVAFKRHSGQLAQHFAYGSLTKPEYEKAHAMHFYNHLAEVSPTA